MNLASFLRATRGVKLLKSYAGRPVIGRWIRWAARQLRNVEQYSLSLSTKNRRHDAAQTAMLDRYRNGEP